MKFNICSFLCSFAVRGWKIKFLGGRFSLGVAPLKWSHCENSHRRHVSLKAHGGFAGQLVTGLFIELLVPEKSLHVGLKSADFKFSKSFGNPVRLWNFFSKCIPTICFSICIVCCKICFKNLFVLHVPQRGLHGPFSDNLIVSFVYFIFMIIVYLFFACHFG